MGLKSNSFMSKFLKNKNSISSLWYVVLLFVLLACQKDTLLESEQNLTGIKLEYLKNTQILTKDLVGKISKNLIIFEKKFLYEGETK